MSSLTVEPAYGRDYKSKAAMLQDLGAGKDFLGTNPILGLMGTVFSIRDLASMKVTQLSLRYGKLRKQAIVKVSEIPVPSPKPEKPKPRSVGAMLMNNAQDAWEEKVDAIIQSDIGVGLYDLIDMDLVTPFEEGVKAEDFAAEILSNPMEYM